MVGTQAGEVVAEGMQLELVGSRELERAAQFLYPLEQLPLSDVREQMIAGAGQIGDERADAGMDRHETSAPCPSSSHCCRRDGRGT